MGEIGRARDIGCESKEGTMGGRGNISERAESERERGSGGLMGKGLIRISY